MSEWYLNPTGSYTTVGMILFVLLLLLFLLPVARSKTTPQRRVVLVTFRLAVLALLTFAMLRPSLVHTTSKKQTATLIVLVDRSRSMMVADAFGNKTRWESLNAALGDAIPGLAQLAEEYAIKTNV